MDTLTMYIAILVGMLILYFARRTTPRNLAVPEGPLKGEKEFMPFRLIKKTDISPDTKIFTFHIEGNQCLGLPIGQHIILRANIPTPEVPEGKQFTRKYTPISTLNQAGTFDLLIKIYYKNVHPKFPEGGKMSQYVDSLQIDDTIDVAGPKGNLTYQGNGNIHIANKQGIQETKVKNLGLIAGGTGIAPIYQVIQQIASEPETEVNMFLVYANRNVEDQLLREELSKYNVKIYDVLENPPAEWAGGVGYATEEMLRANLPAPGSDTMILHCGPPPMNRFVRTTMLAIGHSENLVFKF